MGGRATVQDNKSRTTTLCFASAKGMNVTTRQLSWITVTSTLLRGVRIVYAGVCTTVLLVQVIRQQLTLLRWI